MSGRWVQVGPEDDMTSTVSSERLAELIAKYEAFSYAVDRDTAAALRELRALRQGGMVLVPREPTEAMINEGQGAMWDDDSMTPSSVAVYRAMLAAAEKGGGK